MNLVKLWRKIEVVCLAKSRPKWVALLIFLGLVAFVYTYPIFLNVENWGIQDWDQHFFYHAVPRASLLEYGQIPLWNPYSMGGAVLLANPQSRVLSPTFLLVLAFGPVIGLKIEIWLHVVLGLLGGYCLGRHYRLSRPAALLTTFVLMLNSMVALNLSVGMTWFLSVAYLPWLFLFYQKALSHWRYGLGAGLCLALMLFSGGIYPLLISILFLGGYTLLLCVFKEAGWARAMKVLAVIFAFAFGFSAIKFLPMLEFQLTYPRVLYDYSGYSLGTLGYSLLNRQQTLAAIINLPIEQRGFLSGITGGMDENGIYLGLLPLVLATLALVRLDKRSLALLVVGLIFLWISFGNRPAAELWSLLHLLPGYNSMRIAQRFRLGWILPLALLVGLGYQVAYGYLLRWPRLAHFFRLVIPVLIMADLTAVALPIWASAFPISPLTVAHSQAFYQVWQLPAYGRQGWLSVSDTAAITNQPDMQARYTNLLAVGGTLSSMYPAFLANTGTVNGYESANVPHYARPVSDENYKGEVYIEGAKGQVYLDYWSPNRLRVTVQADGPGYLVINQNYYPGWHALTPEPRQVEAINGLLTVPVVADLSRIELYYWPDSFRWGSLITLATVFASLAAFGWYPRLSLSWLSQTNLRGSNDI